MPSRVYKMGPMTAEGFWFGSLVRQVQRLCSKMGVAAGLVLCPSRVIDTVPQMEWSSVLRPKLGRIAN